MRVKQKTKRENRMKRVHKIRKIILMFTSVCICAYFTFMLDICIKRRENVSEVFQLFGLCFTLCALSKKVIVILNATEQAQL